MRRLLSILLAVGALAMSAKADGKSALHVVYAKAKIVEAVDSDSDGLADATEAAIGTDPAVADTDGDGLSDGAEEILLNMSALVADCDGDGFGDGLEAAAGSDPLSADSVPVSISGTIVNGTFLSGPVRAYCSAANAYGWVDGNAATAQVCRAFAAEGCPAAFAFVDVAASGKAFRIDAWADVNANGEYDAWEPAGSFVSDGVSAPGLVGVEICLVCDDSADTDGNGIADVWEWLHFGRLGNSATGDSDYDGLANAEESRWGTDPFNDDTDRDGMTDGDEVLVGFNPAVADKPPQMELHRTSNGMFRVEWDTRYYQGYLPQYTDKLAPPRWRNLVPRVLYESESYPYGRMSVIDSNTNTPQRFYRVRLVK